MRAFLITLCALALVAILGCAREPRIDGRSDAAFLASLDEMKATAENPEAIERALNRIMAEAVQKNPAEPDAAWRAVKRDLDGMTAEELLEEAKAVQLSAMAESALGSAERAVRTSKIRSQ